jgi:hypothetical protein
MDARAVAAKAAEDAGELAAVKERLGMPYAEQGEGQASPEPLRALLGALRVDGQDLEADAVQALRDRGVSAPKNTGYNDDAVRKYNEAVREKSAELRGQALGALRSASEQDQRTLENVLGEDPGTGRTGMGKAS